MDNILDPVTELQTVVTAATNKVCCHQHLRKGSARENLQHRHTTPKPKQTQGGRWLCTRPGFGNGVLTNPWVRNQDRQAVTWSCVTLPELRRIRVSLSQQSCTLLRLWPAGLLCFRNYPSPQPPASYTVCKHPRLSGLEHTSSQPDHNISP